MIAVAEFVKENLWPDLVPNLRSAIQNSNLVDNFNSKWNTINALIILHALLRPFQVLDIFACMILDLLFSSPILLL